MPRSPGRARPLSSDTAVSFQYGTNPGALTESTPPTTLTASTQPLAVTAELTGLTAGTTVYYRVVATNGAGPTDGAVLSFAVAGATPTTTTPASATTNASVRFGNQTLTLTTPTGTSCVAAATGLKVRFTSKATSTKHPRLTFQSASFFIDRGLRRRVRKTITVRHKRKQVTVTVDVANQITATALCLWCSSVPNLVLAPVP